MRTGCVSLSTYQGKHLIDSGELVDGVAILMTVGSVSLSLTIGSLRDTDSLRHDT